jgi:hypothetical protein
VAVNVLRTDDVRRHRARTVLTQVPALECASDLDLAVFFAAFPRTFLASEQLARLLGYQITEIARSLDVLLAGYLTRSAAMPEPSGERSSRMTRGSRPVREHFCHGIGRRRSGRTHEPRRRR